MDSAPFLQPQPSISANKTSARNLMFEIAIGGLLVFSMALPSGALFGIPFKHIFYIWTISAITYNWAKNNIRIDGALVLLFFATSAFVFFFILIGIFNPSNFSGLVLKEGFGVFTAFSITIILLIAINTRLISSEKIILYAFIGSTIFALWKDAAVLLLVLKVVSFDKVYYFVMEQAGYRIVSSGIFGGLVRINLIIYDFAVGFFYILLITTPRRIDFIPRWLKVAFYVAGGACIFFAFSRLLFIIVALGVIWWVFVKASALKKLLFLGLLISIITVSSAWLLGAYHQRFHAADSSDELRSIQIEALLSEASKAPIIGNGFGSYSKSVIRDPLVPFSYEVQWVGFFAKTGTLGMCFLIFLVALLYREMLKKPLLGFNLILVATLSAFLLGGLTNQYLVSSASGIIYGLHIISKRYFSTRQNTNNTTPQD